MKKNSAEATATEIPGGLTRQTAECAENCSAAKSSRRAPHTGTIRPAHAWHLRRVTF
jgi:hypothetical protein